MIRRIRAVFFEMRKLRQEPLLAVSVAIDLVTAIFASVCVLVIAALWAGWRP